MRLHYLSSIVLALLLCLALISCRKDGVVPQNSDINLIGTWVDPEYNDTVITYTKAENLIENHLGFVFKTGNVVVYRQNSGFCGTPPIVTEDYEGTWTQNDSVVDLTVGYWGGISKYTWKIISIDNQHLVISIIKSSFQTGK
jgi:hypothetical protein